MDPAGTTSLQAKPLMELHSSCKLQTAQMQTLVVVYQPEHTATPQMMNNHRHLALARLAPYADMS
jgi:hypothetical protein